MMQAWEQRVITKMTLHKWHEMKMTYYTNNSYGIHPKIRSHEWINNSAGLTTNSDETITSLRWGTEQHRTAQTWITKVVNHRSMYLDLFADSHLLTAQKSASQCYVIDRHVGTIAQRSVYYPLHQWFSNCGTRTTSGTRRPSRWYAKRPTFCFSSQKIYSQL